MQSWQMYVLNLEFERYMLYEWIVMDGRPCPVLLKLLKSPTPHSLYCLNHSKKLRSYQMNGVQLEIDGVDGQFSIQIKCLHFYVQSDLY